MHIITIIGARPQFVKAAVLSRYLKNNPSLGISETLVHTGQHYDANMSDIFFTQMDIPHPDVNLHLGSGSHGVMTGTMLAEIEKILLDKKPDAVLVYGDTNSTLAGALAASKLLIPVIHVEAGLRSYMMAMPEEQNRRLTDHIATWLFCPTKTAIDNLAKEGIVHNAQGEKASADNKYVIQTGDIMYDASLYYRQKAVEKNIRSENLCGFKDNFLLLTIHRAENTDNLERLKAIIDGINSVKDKNFVFPLHPRTRKILESNGFHFDSHVQLIEPVGYLEMISLESACSGIVTDSGGVQKEAYFFNKPCITLRDTTEWTELVESGWNTLVGADTNKIISSINNIHTPDGHPDLYGNGNTVEQICAGILA